MRSIELLLRTFAACSLGAIAVSKFFGDMHRGYFSQESLVTAAAVEGLISLGLLLPRTATYSLVAVIFTAMTWLFLGYFVIPASAPCGCLGGIALLERNRTAIAGLIGAAAVWALFVRGRLQTRSVGVVS
jgi:hypothetical protein